MILNSRFPHTTVNSTGFITGVVRRVFWPTPNANEIPGCHSKLKGGLGLLKQRRIESQNYKTYYGNLDKKKSREEKDSKRNNDKKISTEPNRQSGTLSEIAIEDFRMSERKQKDLFLERAKKNDFRFITIPEEYSQESIHDARTNSTISQSPQGILS